MNILLIANRYPKGPNDTASPFVPDFVRALRALGTRVLVVTPLYGRPPEQDDADVFRFTFGQTDSGLPIGSWGLLDPRTLGRISRFLRRGEAAVDELIQRVSIDHIFALWALPSGWFARRAARKHGVPYSVWCLGSDINVWATRPIFHGMIGRVLRDAQTVFADGFALAKAARQLSGRHCRFLPSLRFLNPDLPTESRIRPCRSGFLYAGRIHAQKGVFDLLDAFTQAGPDLGDAELIFIGDGPDSAKLRAAVRHREISDRVQVLGYVPANALVRYYCAVTATVIPSRSDSLPLVFSEAVQCGSPLVVYDTGDLGHFVRRFGLGLIVPPGDVTSLSRALIEIKARTFDLAAGRAAVLDLLDPKRAARTFQKAIGSATAKVIPVRIKNLRGLGSGRIEGAEKLS